MFNKAGCKTHIELTDCSVGDEGPIKRGRKGEWRVYLELYRVPPAQAGPPGQQSIATASAKKQNREIKSTENWPKLYSAFVPGWTKISLLQVSVFKVSYLRAICMECVWVHDLTGREHLLPCINNLGKSCLVKQHAFTWGKHACRYFWVYEPDNRYGDSQGDHRAELIYWPAEWRWHCMFASPLSPKTHTLVNVPIHNLYRFHSS